MKKTVTVGFPYGDNGVEYAISSVVASFCTERRSYLKEVYGQQFTKGHLAVGYQHKDEILAGLVSIREKMNNEMNIVLRPWDIPGKFYELILAHAQTIREIRKVTNFPMTITCVEDVDGDMTIVLWIQEHVSASSLEVICYDPTKSEDLHGGICVIHRQGNVRLAHVGDNVVTAVVKKMLAECAEFDALNCTEPPVDKAAGIIL
ncbi:MAG: hypothetical protein HGA67_00115 [Candidatus Yonathbacteria bacterium]|nr:hypothetical protein [Candidatus Yonathbacteria bacterium]